MKKNHMRWRFFAEGIQNTLFYMLFPFIVLYLNDAWNPYLASFALAIISVLGVISGIWGGIFADRIGRKPMMISSSIGFLVATILFIIGRIAGSNIMVFGSFGLMSIAYSSYIPAGRAYISDWLDEKEQKKAYVFTYQIFNVAVTLGPLIGSFIFDSMPIWFIGTSLVSVLTLVYISLWKTPEFQVNRKLGNEERMNANGKFTKAVLLIGKDKRLLIFVVASVFAAQAFMQLEILLPSTLLDRLSESISIFGFTINASQNYASLLMTNGILVIILGSMAARLSSKYSTRFGFVGSSILYAFSMVIFGFSQNYIGFFIGVLILTVAELLVVSTQDSYIAGIAPANQKAQYFAAANIRYSISRIFAPQLLAFVPLIRHEGAFLVAAFSSLISAFLFFMLFQKSLLAYNSKVGQSISEKI